MAIETRYEPVALLDGTEVRLARYTYEDGRVDPDILVRTRTGTKIHLGSPGSSVTRCGVWLRTNGVNFAVDAGRCRRENLCESCFPVHAAEKAQPEPQVSARMGNGKRAADKTRTSKGGTMAGQPDPKDGATKTEPQTQDAPKAAEAKAEAKTKPTAADFARMPGASIVNDLTEQVKGLVKGLKVEKSKAGGKRYYRVLVDKKSKTLAYATIRGNGASVSIGSAAPVKLTTDEKPERLREIAERIAKRQEELVAS